jgi:hypothetical protein
MAIKIPIISEFNPKGINAAKAEFATLQGTGSKAMFLLQKAALPAAAAIGSIAAVIKPAIDAASDFQESTSKVNVVFGKASKSIKDFAATAATSLGQSKQSVLDAAGVFGTFGKAAGLAGDDLALFTTDFVTLSTDLASFNNTTPEEAITAIGAALRGESEPLRRYGVLLNDAVLRQEALTLGIYDGKGALTAQQKVLAAQAAIYKQTGDAQGDFLRTSDGLANSQRTLGAIFKNVQIELGTKLLPAIQEFSNSLVDISLWVQRNPETFTKIGKGFEYIFKMVDPATKAVRGFLGFLKSVASIVGESDKATGAWNQELGRSSQQQMRMADAAGIFNKGLTEQEQAVGGAKKEVESYAAAFKDKLGDALSEAKDNLESAKDAFTNFATSVADSLKSAFSFADAQEAGKETGSGFLQGLRDQVAGIIGYTKKVDSLLTMGLSQDALAQVLAAGQEAGTAIADQLIAGGATAITETNALVESTNAAAAKVGLNAASQWYQAGIDGATAIVGGIQEELDKLTPKLMKKMDALAAKLKRTVNIDVVINERVNKIVANLGGIPAMAEGGIVNKPTLALIGEGSGPEAVIPLSKMNNMGGGGDVNINVTGGLSTSAEIGQSVVNALRAYSRSAGPLALNIA